MLQRIYFLVIICIGVQNLHAQQPENTYYIGHSLINLNMPAMVHSLALDAGISQDKYDYQIGNGANLQYQWDTLVGFEQGLLYQHALPTGNYDNIIITEAIALKSHITWSNTFQMANHFFRYAHQFNPSINMYVYETWHCVNSGTELGCMYDDEDHIDWRARLTDDLSVWESIGNDVMANNPSFTVHLVPGGQGLARLYDAIVAGNVPGKSSIKDFFTDDIHLTIEGNYFIACIFYSTIYGKSPEGLTNATHDEWGGAFPVIDPSLATVLQRIAWETVCAYPNSGVNCTVKNNNLSHQKSESFSYHSASNMLYGPADYNGFIRIVNVHGQLLKTMNYQGVPLHINMTTPGIYFIVDKSGKTSKIVVF